MKKLLSLILLNPALCFAIGAAGHASGHASAHSSAHSSAHASIAHESIAAHESAITAAHPVISAHAQQNDLMSKVFVNQNTGFPKGVLTCNANRDQLPDGAGHITDSCRVPKTWSDYTTMSIHDFFMKYKPTTATKIDMVIYDSSSSDFEIYYE